MVSWINPDTKQKVVKPVWKKYKEDENGFYVRVHEALHLVYGPDVHVSIVYPENED